MTVDEIFETIINHQIKGLMVHEQLTEYYDFLGLEGYKQCHEHHYNHENKVFRRTVDYYIKHYNKLVQSVAIENPNVIPTSWYGYTRLDVDANIKKNGVKNGLKVWHDWEIETKDMYEDMYLELMELNELVSAKMVMKCICDVDSEIMDIERYMMEKKALDYDIASIISEQDGMSASYR